MLEKDLSRDYPNHRVLFVSSGTCALYLILKAIAKTRGVGEVIFPSTVCPSVVLAAIESGFTPRFCDVELDTFCLSEKTVKPLINSKTRAVLVVYMFGKSFDIKPLEMLSHKHNFDLIEDVALALGGRTQDGFLGRNSKYTLMSFNPKKIIGQAAGGAALAKSNVDFEIMKEEYSKLELKMPADLQESLLQSFRDYTMEFFGKSREENLKPGVTAALKILKLYSPAFFNKIIWQDSFSEKLSLEYAHLERQRVERYNRYRAYQKFLPRDMLVVEFNEQEMIWRLPLLTQTFGQQKRIIEKLRKAGFLVSDHYFPMSVFFGTEVCAVANRIGLTALNLWLDHTVNEKNIPWICEAIANTI